MRIRIAVALPLLAALAACGQKGALYLPDEERQKVEPPAAQADIATDRSNEARKRTH